MKKIERNIEDRTILDEFAEQFCDIVNKHCKYIVCSGFVAIAHGRTRGTEDIDMIVENLNKEQFINLHKDLIKGGFVCIQSDSADSIYMDYLSNGDSVRYVTQDKNFFPPEMEIKFAKDELDNEQLNSRTKLPLTKLDIYFSSIEGNIAFKEELLKSQKDLEDAKHLRIIYEGKFDEDKIRQIKEKIRLIKLNKN